MQLTTIAWLIETATDSSRTIEDDAPMTGPKRVEEYELPAFKIPKGRKSKKKEFQQIRAIINVCCHNRFKEGCTLMPLSCTHKPFLCICGSVMNVSRRFKTMAEIGIIRDLGSEYSYIEHRSKEYLYFVENEKKFTAWCKHNHINMAEELNVLTNVQNITTLPTYLPSKDKIRFDSNLNILCPDDISKEKCENDLTAILYDNYPFLNDYQRKAEEINLCLPYELRHRLKPHFHWVNEKENRYITKIGIRDTNKKCSCPHSTKHYTDGKRFKAINAPVKKKAEFNHIEETRERVRKRYGLNLEYDVKSSVPRLTLSLNWGTWVDESIDIYERIFDEFKKIDPTQKYDREAFKKLHMSAYFDDERLIGRNCFYRMKDNREQAQFEDVKETLQQYQRAVVEAEGGQLYGSEIFLFESCIYLDVCRKLKKMGFFVWQVYDGFFAKKKGVSQEEFTQICRELVEESFYDFLEIF